MKAGVTGWVVMAAEVSGSTVTVFRLSGVSGVTPHTFGHTVRAIRVTMDVMANDLGNWLRI